MDDNMNQNMPGGSNPGTGSDNNQGQQMPNPGVPPVQQPEPTQPGNQMPEPSVPENPANNPQQGV